ncbi:putative reverse transcriptase domain-containing protein [Tanacetum coccineum]
MKEKLYAKFIKCKFWLQKVQFLGNVINGDGIHVDPSKIQAVKNWEAPRTPSEVCSFLQLAGYYRRFIENFSKIAKLLTILTQKNKTYVWGEEQEEAFQILKDKLCNEPVLALHDGPEDFVVYCDASGLGLGCVLMQRGKEALGTRLDMSTAYHPQTNGQSEHTIHTLEDMLRACVMDFRGSWDVHLPLVEFSYNNSYHSSVRCAPLEALYERKYRSPIILAEVGEGELIGPEIVQETTKKISQIKDRLKAACDRQKIYANRRKKTLEFSVGDHVLLKVVPWKGVVCFGKNGKLEPRFVGPFEITERIGPVAYRLRLPEEINGVHDTF